MKRRRLLWLVPGALLVLAMAVVFWPDDGRAGWLRPLRAHVVKEEAHFEMIPWWPQGNKVPNLRRTVVLQNVRFHDVAKGLERRLGGQKGQGWHFYYQSPGFLVARHRTGLRCVLAVYAARPGHPDVEVSPEAAHQVVVWESRRLSSWESLRTRARAFASDPFYAIDL